MEIFELCFNFFFIYFIFKSSTDTAAATLIALTVAGTFKSNTVERPLSSLDAALQF